MPALLCVLSACAGGSPVVSGPSAREFVVRDVLDVSAPDQIPVITAPRFEPIAGASAWLTDRSPVIAVAQGESVRAYPIAVMARHEVVNDRLGARAIAVTYFPLSDSAAVWDRSLGGRAFTLRSSGKIYRATPVLYDVETESLWLQMTGAARLGPMKGAQLTLLPSMILPFGTFRERFPSGEVLVRPSARLNYDVNPYRGYERRAGPPSNLFLSKADGRLGAMTPVTGAVSAAGALAVRSPGVLANETLEGREDGLVASPLDAATLSAGRPRRIVNLYRSGTDEPVPQVHALWFAWAAMYPGSGLS